MPEIKSLDGLDPNQIKESLKTFLETSSTFSDYNFEGSALSTIVDLLVRNTHYYAYLANMLANESTLDTAQLRQSVVSHARKLNYIPKSKQAAIATLDLLVKPVNKVGLETSISIPQNKQFITNVNNSVKTFTTNKVYTAFLNADGNYFVKDVEIYQGTLVKNAFTKTTSSNIFVIPNKNIDTRTLKVFVKGSSASNSRTTYRKVSDITKIDGESEIYFLTENSDGYYQIEFGDDILGKSIISGNVVEIEYINVDNEFNNGAENFQLVSSISGYTDVSITTKIPSNGGADREDKEKIRVRAPRYYTTQKRAVTATDYATILLTEYPAIKNAFGWGGEDQPEPEYGRVFIAVVPNQGFVISQSVKDSIVNSILKPYNVGSITPVIVDAKNILLDLDVVIDIDRSLTELTFSEITSQIITLSQDYSELNLENFDSDYIRSRYERYLLNNVTGLRSVNTTSTMKLEFTPEYGVVQSINYDFANPIVPKSFEIQTIVAQGYTLNSGDTMFMRDDGNGNIDLYTLVGGTDERVSRLGVGTVNYDKGTASINKINFIFDPVRVGVNTPYAKATPVNNDINSVREFVIYFNEINVT